MIVKFAKLSILGIDTVKRVFAIDGNPHPDGLFDLLKIFQFIT